jgi:hypothetical protein
VLPETELMLLPLQYEKAPKTNEMPPPYAFAPKEKYLTAVDLDDAVQSDNEFLEMV